MDRPYQLAGPAPVSRREQRDEEDRQALGGMRLPARSVDKMPRARSVGAQVRTLLSKVLDAHPSVLSAVAASLDGQAMQALPDSVVELARALLSRGLNSGPPQAALRGPLRPDLFRAFSAAVGDPDTDLPDWLLRGAPLGIELPIHSCHIFPALPQDEPAHVPELLTFEEGWANYTSLEDNLQVGVELLRQAEAAGFCKLHGSRAELAAGLGSDSFALSRLGLISKARADGSLKHRLVWDFRRSHVNARVKQPERITLPQLGDLVPAAQTLARERRPGEGLWLYGLDFRDAFFNVPAAPQEQAYLCTKVGPWWVQAFTLVFGAASAPLVWGRFAAWTGRSLAAILPPTHAFAHIYVDDPLLQLRGTKEQAARLVGVALLWLTAVGLPIAWAKAHGGTGPSSYRREGIVDGREGLERRGVATARSPHARRACALRSSSSLTLSRADQAGHSSRLTGVPAHQHGSHATSLALLWSQSSGVGLSGLP